CARRRLLRSYFDYW
nr:immunoglobulin heavy chain junction region [Mus musculus]MBK4189967.1 immunoglobulin heavy chain junction region [Mus musculus]